MLNNEIVPGFDNEQDDNLRIRLQKVAELDGCLLVALTGHIDTYNSNHFQERIQKAIEAGFVNLIFQCASLNYVSSTGISSFTAFMKTVKSQGGDLVLLDVKPKVHEVFHLHGFAQFLNNKDSMDDCINHFHTGHHDHKVSVFPKHYSCPICSKRHKAFKAGHFNCSECKTPLTIDSAGHVFLK